jgi:hypothetical protein
MWHLFVLHSKYSTLWAGRTEKWPECVNSRRLVATRGTTFMKHVGTYVIRLGARFCFYCQWIVSTIALRHLYVIDLERHEVAVRLTSHVGEPPGMR